MLNRKHLPYLMWGFPLLFFTFQFILRLWPSLTMHSIMERLAIDATGFGFLSAVYYYGYAGMQIPVAILLDRWGARHTLFACAVLCGLATLGFTYTDNFYLACLSRFLVGVGSAVGFLGVSKVVSEWFSPDHYARMIGFSFTFGLMGAVYGGEPVDLLINRYGISNISATLAFVSLGVGVLTYMWLRAPAEKEICVEDAFKAAHFKELLSSPFIWLLAIAGLLMVGALEGFADVWGVQYLVTAYDIPHPEAAGLRGWLFKGMIFGGPLLTLLSKRLGSYTVIMLSGIGMALAFLLLLSGVITSWYGFAALLFGVGILCCYQVIVFAVGAQTVSPVLLSVTIAFLNSINMLGGSFFHTIIGMAMDATWTGLTDAEGVRQYGLESYTSSLLVIPACAFIGAVVVGSLGWYTGRKSSRI